MVTQSRVSGVPHRKHLLLAAAAAVVIVVVPAFMTVTRPVDLLLLLTPQTIGLSGTAIKPELSISV